MLDPVYRFFFRRLGWTIEGNWPAEHRKYLIVLAPHTSNWDFMIGLCVRATSGVNSHYLGKKELFRFPFGWLFRKLGGYPVERSRNTNFVDAVVKIYEKHDDFIVTITPEGTRKSNPEWKTGFYYIAQKAHIPIVPVSIDYPTKRVIIREAMFVGNDLDSLILDLKSWFRQFKGKNPDWGIEPE
ncbi:MAG: 1-acyl-sn-glycerol-3-phosphate acyltransferase [Flavobacteriales bacterium]|nr:1-acyl-sn-glycerol-3-phosphate acyltransferase [Flavobacteriales bacterium]